MTALPSSSSSSPPVSTNPAAWYSIASGVSHLVGRKIWCFVLPPTNAEVRHFEYRTAVAYVFDPPTATAPLPFAFWHLILKAPNLNSCSDSSAPFVLFVLLATNSAPSAGPAPSANAHVVANSPTPSLKCLMSDVSLFASYHGGPVPPDPEAFSSGLCPTPCPIPEVLAAKPTTNTGE